jgi:deoxyribose-phosphate aldolase
MAIHDGATEIDIVMPVGKFLSGDYDGVVEEIQEIKDVCGDKKLKVILETGALKTATNIKKAAIIAMYAGADYIKTSTGKLEPAATPEAAFVMCQAIKEYYDETGKKIGIKAAGGISTTQDALLYYSIVNNVLGKEWLNNKLFRIGASRLFDNLLESLISSC